MLIILKYEENTKILMIIFCEYIYKKRGGLAPGGGAGAAGKSWPWRSVSIGGAKGQ